MQISDQLSTDQAVPTGILQALLRERTGDRTATITDLSPIPIKTGVEGGKQVLRTRIAWMGEAGPAVDNWVVKRWRPGGFTGVFMQVSRPLEVLAWKHGLLAPATLPDGMAIPYIGATADDAGESAWIVMEDVAPAIEAVGACESTDDRIQMMHLLLDRLARWHALWEQPDRQAILDAHPWLISQDHRLRCGADFYAICLGQEPRCNRYIPPQMMRKAICSAASSFIRGLREDIRDRWDRLLYQRAPLLEAFADLPQTLIHGDFYLGQTGLRQRDDLAEVLFFDWEWIGRGSPAFDVRQAIEGVVGMCHRQDLGRSLSAYYFDCYRLHGGSRMDRPTWEKAYALATIFEGVRAFPFIAGGSPDDRSYFHGWLDEETIGGRIEEVSKAIHRWLL